MHRRRMKAPSQSEADKEISFLSYLASRKQEVHVSMCNTCTSGKIDRIFKSFGVFFYMHIIQNVLGRPLSADFKFKFYLGCSFKNYQVYGSSRD